MLCLQWVDGPDADSVHERAGETFAVEARERGISLAVVLVSTEHQRGRLMVMLTV
jgi:hypothetical protein